MKGGSRSTVMASPWARPTTAHAASGARIAAAEPLADACAREDHREGVRRPDREVDPAADDDRRSCRPR